MHFNSYEEYLIKTYKLREVSKVEIVIKNNLFVSGRREVFILNYNQQHKYFFKLDKKIVHDLVEVNQYIGNGMENSFFEELANYQVEYYFSEGSILLKLLLKKLDIKIIEQ